MKLHTLALLFSCTLLAGCVVEDRVAYRHLDDDIDDDDVRVTRHVYYRDNDADDDDGDHTRVIERRYVTYPESTYYVRPATRTTVLAY